MTEDEVAGPVRQVEEACHQCGSFYRRGNYCSSAKCGAYAPVSAVAPESYTREGRPPQGKTWNSKLHRYEKQGEVIPATAKR